MLVKNEEDIIASTLKAAAEWSDKLIVLDNGSTDRTAAAARAAPPALNAM